MKSREETARFIEHQFDNFGSYECKLPKERAWHYGKQEVRELMDFIYGGPPKSEKHQVRGKALRNGHRA